MQSADDQQQEALPEPSTAKSDSAASQLESAGTNSSDGDAAAAAGRKWQFGRQLSRSKEVSCSRAVQDLMEHQIFVSVQGNQFKWNRKGDFGIFFY